MSAEQSQQEGGDFSEIPEVDLAELLERFAREAEIWTGRRIHKAVPESEVSQLERKFRTVAQSAKNLVESSEQPLTPEVARRVLAAKRAIVRHSLGQIPKRTDPLDYLIAELEKLEAVPRNLQIPEGLDYEAKHWGLRDFVQDLLARGDRPTADSFLRDVIRERGLVMQFQHVFASRLTPAELKPPPRRPNARSADRLQIALRKVTADWDPLISVVYGLFRISEGRPKQWSGVLRVNLRAKVNAIRQDARLAELAMSEWVTVRNSLNHGAAFYSPGPEVIEFRDRDALVTWSLPEAYLQACDILLANVAMLFIWTFESAAGIDTWKEQVAALRALAKL